MNQDPALAKAQQAPSFARLYARPLDAWRRLGSNPVARNSAYSIGSHASIALLQGLQFFLLARALGPHEFGTVASVVAITSSLLPFCGLGLGSVAIMNIARGKARAEESLGNGLAVTAVTAVIGVGLALIIGQASMNLPGIWLVVFLFGVSELLLSKFIDLAAGVFMGLERQLVAAFFYNLMMFARLCCAAILYVGWTQPTALAWAQLHLSAGALTAIVVLCVCIRLLGRPRADYATAKSDIGKGVFFSIVNSAASVQTDVDKIILARMVSPAMAGAYTAAFRFVTLAYMPIMAIMFSVQARIFQKTHKDGLLGVLRAVRLLISITVAYCLLIALCIYAAAPAVPWLLGEAYQPSIEILQWLCLLPLFFAIRSFASTALMGVDAQRRVSFLHTVTAVLALLLNVLLVPEHGWRGAAVAAYASQGFLIAGLLVTIVLVLGAQRKTARRRTV